MHGLKCTRQFAVGYRVHEVPLPKIKEDLTIPKLEPNGEKRDFVEASKNKAVPRKNKRTPVFRKLPFGSVGFTGPICVDPNDKETQYFGIKKRIAAKVGTAKHLSCADFDKIGAFVDKHVLPKLEPLREIMTFDEWLEESPYNQSRRLELRSIHAHKVATGFKSMGRVKPFVKREAYSEFKYARWIMAANDTFKVFSGPIFKSMEKVIYDAKIFGGHTNFIKHVPVKDRPRLITALRKIGKLFYGTDYTAFESHMTRDVMIAIEARVYKHMLKHFPALAKKLNNVLLGKRGGTTRDGASFKCISRRMSGDACTSLGNGLTNLIVWAYLCHERGIKWDGYVEGDDGIFTTVGGEIMPSDFERLGFNIKVTKSDNPNDLSFCGLVSIGDSVIRDPLPFLQKFGWTHSKIWGGVRVMQELLRAKALSAAYETPNCPIVRAVADRAIELTNGYDACFDVDGYHNRVVKETSIEVPVITENIRLEFQRLYNISISKQLELEARILKSDDLDFLFSELNFHPHTTHYALSYIEYG